MSVSSECGGKAPSQDARVTIAFVVAHPDDESLWIGGTINGLKMFQELNVLVACIQGGADEARSTEFRRALDTIGVRDGIFLGSEPIGRKHGPLVGISNILSQVTRSCDENIGLLITHSPYGDERRHPHHVQLYKHLQGWALEHDIAFGFFSYCVLPQLSLVPLLPAPRRMNNLHLLNIYKCISLTPLKSWICPPQYLVQLGIDVASKQRMLNCYGSIDRRTHERQYFAWTSGVEHLYLTGMAGLRPFSLFGLAPPKNEQHVLEISS